MIEDLGGHSKGWGKKMKKKVMFVFGTRPEAIKLCPLILKFYEFDDEIETIVCVTGQHREMLDQIMDVFQIVPKYDLNIMKENQTLNYVTATIIEKVGEILSEENPDLLIVQGDTTSTFAAALAAFYKQVPIAHVEAGLRTNNKLSPFPEEINRRLTSQMSDIHFAPTVVSKQNLINEGFDENKIVVTGNTVIDALLWVKNKLNIENARFEALSSIDFSKKIILVTGHRRENFGEKLKNICNGLIKIAQKNPEVLIVYPVHLNPNVKNTVEELLSPIQNIKLLPPMDYVPFIDLMSKSYLIITDSGGIQEEAPSLGKPVLVTRDTTERPEAVNSGCAKIVGTRQNELIDEANQLLSDENYYRKISEKKNPYGDGDSCDKIVDTLRKSFFCM